MLTSTAMALVASLGNRLSVVDLERDHVGFEPIEHLARPRGRARGVVGAWARAEDLVGWGGGGAERGERIPRPIRRQTRISSPELAGGDGDAEYDLRRADPRRSTEISRGAHTGTRRVSRVARVWGRGALRGRRLPASSPSKGRDQVEDGNGSSPSRYGRRCARPRVRRVGARSNPRGKRATRSWIRAVATGA